MRSKMLSSTFPFPTFPKMAKRSCSSHVFTILAAQRPDTLLICTQCALFHTVIQRKKGEYSIYKFAQRFFSYLRLYECALFNSHVNGAPPLLRMRLYAI